MKKRNYNYNIHHCEFIIILTIITMNPKQQTTKVFQRTCINAIKEKSFSMLSENEMILLCRSINIFNVAVEDLWKEIFSLIILKS